MNIQEIAQQLVNELSAELNKKVDEQSIIKGAIQGVNLLYTKIINAQQQEQVADEQDSPVKASKSKGKAKK